jgi:predicted dehydrogenase
MTAPIAAGVIGAGPHAQALIAHQAPLGRVRLAAFAAAPGGADAASVAKLARQAAAPLRPWQEVAADAGLPAILVLAAPGARAAPVAAALAAGKTVLCPPPAAGDDDELAALAAAQRQGGGRLLIGGEIACSEVGRHALVALHAPEFGPLRSLYLAIRQPRGGGGDVLEAPGWEAVDFLLCAMSGAFAQVRVNAGALFGAARDSAVLLLRTDAQVVVTVELARCLPPTLPAPGLGEVEIDAMGASQALRALPLASAVQIWREDGRDLVPWIDPPVLAMLRAIEDAVDAPDAPDQGIARASRALALMSAIRAAAGPG